MTTTDEAVSAAIELREAALCLAEAINSRTKVIIRFLVAIVVLGALAFALTWLQARNTLTFEKRGIGCMLEQQAEHRLTNYESHVQIAGDLGNPLKIDGGAMPPQPAAVAKLRKEFGADCNHFSPSILNSK